MHWAYILELGRLLRVSRVFLLCCDYYNAHRVHCAKGQKQRCREQKSQDLHFLTQRQGAQNMKARGKRQRQRRAI